nr:uncharacterized protein LOC126054357 isoform X1 [Helicoverpa armigera]
MAETLHELYKNLVDIRKYLIKIGASRRKGSIVIKKLKDADDIVRDFNIFLQDYSESKSNVEESECILIEKLTTNFHKLYEEILDLCTEESSSKMSAKFDLKIALQLLPVSTDDEASIKQLIDGIEYYQSELDEPSKKQLMNFTLKSRLSQAAKLKLSSKYDSIEELIKDLKLHLLPKKSATAIQRRMQNTKQNNLSIDEFAKEITEMFVELTIAQSDGNDEHFKVLKPLNEKQAIKCFSDGLRNRRLSTIISARNYNYLKDAVQAAIDEDVQSPSTSTDVFTMNYRSRAFRRRPGRGRSAFSGKFQPPQQRTETTPTQRYRGHPFRGSQTRWRATRSNYRGRGKFSYNRPSYQANARTVHTLSNSIVESAEGQQESSRDTQNQNNFFRD